MPMPMPAPPMSFRVVSVFKDIAGATPENMPTAAAILFAPWANATSDADMISRPMKMLNELLTSCMFMKPERNHLRIR